jgi:transposase
MNTQQTAYPKLYIGIDIHKRSWKVHCVTDLFASKSFSMSPDPKQFDTYVSKYFKEYEVTVAYELVVVVIMHTAVS